MKRIVIDFIGGDAQLIEAISININLITEQYIIKDVRKNSHTFPIRGAVIRSQDEYISIYGPFEKTVKSRAELLLEEAALKEAVDSKNIKLVQ